MEQKSPSSLFFKFSCFHRQYREHFSVIDEEGRRGFDASYDAWGRQTVTKNEIGLRRGYTGHEMLNEFGIINMNGRLYDPLLGRFLSPDNYVQAPDNSQSFNRYSYCLNNPLKYVDPSGEFFLFTLWNATKDFLVNTFVKSWSQGFNAWSNSSNWISTTNAFKIDMGLYKGNFKQIISRFTWEAPQTILGYLAGSIQNTLYGVKSVSYYGGATAIETYKAKWGGFTLGSFIIGERGLQADPNNPLFQHEYGHYLQSQSAGLFYLQRYAIPSLIDAAGDSDHNYHATEQDANIRAFKYFMKHEPNFEKADGPRWDKRYNPIKGYDWSKPIDSPANQLVLKKGTMSLGWADYMFGPSILIPGFFNVFQLMQ